MLEEKIHFQSCALFCLKKKSVDKWARTVQTWVVQGLTLHRLSKKANSFGILSSNV